MALPEHAPPYVPTPVISQPAVQEPKKQPRRRRRRNRWRTIGAVVVGVATVVGTVAGVHAAWPGHRTNPAHSSSAGFAITYPPRGPTLTEPCTFVVKVRGKLPQGKAIAIAYQEMGSDTNYCRQGTAPPRRRWHSKPWLRCQHCLLRSGGWHYHWPGSSCLRDAVITTAATSLTPSLECREPRGCAGLLLQPVLVFWSQSRAVTCHSRGIT
jgi:hypothetical protein